MIGTMIGEGLWLILMSSHIARLLRRFSQALSIFGYFDK